MSLAKYSLAILTSFSFLSANATSSVQEEVIESITVTSNFKQQSLANAPTSIAVVTSEQILAQGDQHFENVLASVANVNFSGESSRPKFLQIRGVGERSQYSGAPNSSVGFIVDDIDLSGLGMAASMYDVNQVEVLRGPQGTRFGANALAGMVYIQSNAPTDVAEHGIKTSFGNDDLINVAGYSTGALSDNLNYRVSIEQHQQNGFRDNLFLGKDDTNGIDELSGKLKLAYQASDELTVDFTLLFADMDNGYDVWTLNNNGFNTLTDHPGIDKQKSSGSSLKFSYSGFSTAELTAISSFTTTDHHNAFDGDWANAEYWASKSCTDYYDENGNGDDSDQIPCVYEYLWDKEADRDVWSQEIRINNKQNHKIFNQSTDWLVGVYVSKLDEENDLESYYNGWEDEILLSHYQAKNLAIFAQLDSTLPADYQLSVGLRVENRDSEYIDSEQDSFSPSETMWGGHIALSKALNNDHNAYARIAKGYKAGGFNMGLPAELSQFKEFDTETLFNYEFGIDSSYLNNAFHSRLAFFYMDRKDQQVNASQQDPNNPQRFTIYTANATSSTSYGAELDLAWQVTANLNIYATLGYLDARYDNYAYFDKYGSTIDISDRTLAHAPKSTYSLGGSYTSDDGLFVNVSTSGKSSFYFSDSHSEKSSSNQLINARIGYETQTWSVYLWARNLTDEKVATRGFYFGNEPDIDWTAKKFERYAAPRQVGVTLDYQF